jgi:hypothetical protein
MPKIENLNKLLSKLSQKQKEAVKASEASVTTGFTQNYAVHVHENMEAKHNVGQAKFLEQPARELNNSGELSNIMTKALKRGATVEQGLLLDGLRIQREAQKLTPVDTGALKASAFTSLTRDEEQAAETALATSNAIKLSVTSQRAKKSESKKLKGLPRTY